MGLKDLAQEILSTADAIKWDQTKGSGKGGQRRNKVETKAVLSFYIPKSQLLNEQQKQTLLDTLKVTNEGVLKIGYGRRRLLTHNQQMCREIFAQAIIAALTPVRQRKLDIPKSVQKSINQKRKKGKVHQSEKKKLRGKVRLDNPS